MMFGVEPPFVPALEWGPLYFITGQGGSTGVGYSFLRVSVIAGLSVMSAITVTLFTMIVRYGYCDPKVRATRHELKNLRAKRHMDAIEVSGRCW